MSTIIKNMTGINIVSKYFSNNTFLEFFPKYSDEKKKNRVSLIYGGNGTGKSTIANGFRNYRDKDSSKDIQLYICNEKEKLDITDKYDRNNIYIFDENYISSRIKVKEKGLDTIVLFGEQVNLEEDIINIKDKIKKYDKLIEELKEDYKDFTDKFNVKSKEYWYKKIADKLKENKGWAEKGSIIKGHKQNLAVNIDEIERIGNSVPDKTLEELNKEFSETYEQFILTDSDAMPIYNKVKLIYLKDDILEKSKKLLKEIIDKPSLTIREERLLSLFGIDYIFKVGNYIEDENNTICKSCFQPIEKEYRKKSLQEIKNILNEETKDFKSELEKLLIPEIIVEEYEEYSTLSLYDSIFKKMDEYNILINEHNFIIKNKIDNPYESIEYDLEIRIIYEKNRELNEDLKKLEDERIKHNRIIEKRLIVQEELLEMNDYIAYEYINEMYSTYKRQEKSELDLKIKISEYEAIYSACKEDEERLNFKRRNFEIALDEINKCLKYIFFSDNKLSIELGEDKLYRLKANGESVAPSKISCGERNALALCYYFIEIVEDMDEKSMYKDEMLLVIDDPISSFDIGNRIGIISLLRWKLEQVLKNCSNSKVIIMTHDISVVFNLQKVLNEISRSCKEKSVSAEYSLFQLENRELKTLNYKNYNEYTQLLKQMYQYVISEEVDYNLDISIGNIMRRVLEAFSTFSFKLGTSQLSLREEVLKLLPDDHSRMYYRNLMYRIVLDNESHFKDDARGAVEVGFFSYLSSNEKRKTAKDLLCFIYYLNKTHLISHIPEAESNLCKWCSE